jgi:3-dehydroquinate synthase
VALRLSEDLIVKSHRGPYAVRFEDGSLADVSKLLEGSPRFLVDANVARLHAASLRPILDRPTTIVIEATEENKSLAGTIPVFERLVDGKIRRGDSLVAIGGGIVQDITCFVAATLLRGLPWRFVPTTLLAQADSCIGSKSSINLGSTKNILGTFTPPEEVIIAAGFLETLDPEQIRSGIGEMIKVHAIDGAAAFDKFAADYDAIVDDPIVRLRYIRASLEIKRRYIEEDEFDRGIRNIFNYGHSFGHAIESATGFAIPHGIAISIGMDMANYVAAERGLLPAEHYDRMRTTLRKNYAGHANAAIPMDAMLAALMKDKKNTTTMLGLILPVGAEASIQRVQVAPDDAFRGHCTRFLERLAG